jgi:hypothetical protein
VTSTVWLTQYHGSCTVYAQLVESSSDPDPKVFGGTPSPVLQADLTLGQPSTLDATRQDFDVTWSGPPGSHVLVKYSGNYDDATVGDLTQNWHETLLAPDGSACGTDSEQPTHAGISFDASAVCVNAQPKAGWSVAISYDDAGTTDTQTVSENLAGPPPGYVPCAVNQANFSATWAGTHANPAAELDFKGNGGDLAGCSAWTYTLLAPGGTACGSGPDGTAPDGPQPVTIAPTCSTPPDGNNDWSIRLGYQNPDHSSGTLTVAVGGTPP